MTGGIEALRPHPEAGDGRRSTGFESFSADMA
jgi:hypothetical protein